MVSSPRLTNLTEKLAKMNTIGLAYMTRMNENYWAGKIVVRTLTFVNLEYPFYSKESQKIADVQLLELRSQMQNIMRNEEAIGRLIAKREFFKMMIDYKLKLRLQGENMFMKMKDNMISPQLMAWCNSLHNDTLQYIGTFVQHDVMLDYLETKYKFGRLMKSISLKNIRTLFNILYSAVNTIHTIQEVVDVRASKVYLMHDGTKNQFITWILVIINSLKKNDRYYIAYTFVRLVCILFRPR